MVTRLFYTLKVLLTCKPGMPLKVLSLDCCSCDVTDAGLANLRRVPLENLNLRGGRQFTESGVQSLIIGKPLKSLDLSWCSRITEGISLTLMDLPLVNLFVSGQHPSLSGAGFSLAALDGLILSVPSIKEVLVFSASAEPTRLFGQASTGFLE